MSAPTRPALPVHDVFDLVEAADEFAAVVCADAITQGYSVLLLGESGSGTTVAASRAGRKVGEDLAHRVVSWNEGGAYPPPTDKVAYVLLSRPVGVSLHYRLPAHADGLQAVVRSLVHPGWLR